MWHRFWEVSLLLTGRKAGTEKVREGSCDEGGAETPVFFQLFGFYYQIHGSEFHQQADADCRVLCSGSGDVLTFAGGQADEGWITCITSIRQKIGESRA